MDASKTCPKCGKPLASNAPAGLCPECLMQAGFPTGTEPDAGTKKFSFRPPSVEELKPHFPQLEILNYIGQGGMGSVYKARQPMLDRYVALKILPPEAATGPGFTERFTREARALARLNHPNIVTVHEFGRSRRGNEAEGNEGYHYLVMEFVDGVNLREMQRSEKLSPAQALSIVPKICEALQYAHDEGVVHRDIKPENILVDKKGRIKIADFGIAKILGAEANDRITGAQHVVGTPHYMAPEQVEKPLTVDHRADIYSVGVVFYEMLTGELPLGRFAAPSKKVQIDVRLDEVVLRALEKEPEQRYQQASQVKTDLETISSQPTTSAAPTTPKIAAGKSGLKLRTVAILFGALAFVLAALNPAHAYQTVIVAVAAFIVVVLWIQRAPPGKLERWNDVGYWAVAALLVLDFILPHSWHFSSGLRLGITQPWLFLPHDGHGLIVNPRAISFFSGFAGVVTALVLLAVQRQRLNRRYRRWVSSIAVAILVAAGMRFAIEPFRAMNDAVAPEINPGSTVFVNKLSRRFEPGDIVVYRWFATGYPTKFMLGRVAELPYDNQISIERRNQSPEKILVSDIVGKVIFNTRGAVVPHNGNFVIGQSYFPNGDRIELTSVDRSNDELIARGRYKLVSTEEAMLALNITKEGSGRTAMAPEQSIHILKGEGSFALKHPHPSDGMPHIAMYGSKGAPFANLYFGTKDEAMASTQLRLGLESSVLNPAPKELEQMPSVVVETIPTSGSTDVQPGEMDVEIRFSKDMYEHSWSWSSAWDDSMPSDLGEPTFVTPRTCRLKVKLEPHHTYGYWLNSESFGNFRDGAGNPAVPYLLIFQTKDK